MRCFLLPILGLALCCAQAQDRNNTDFIRSAESIHFGLGVGLDHGGYGLRVDVPVDKHIGFFAGGGYALAGIGWNAGAVIRLMPAERWCPYLTAMYGYNTALVVRNASEHNTLYYGPSFGAGVEMRRRKGPGFWHFGILRTDRPSEVEDDRIRFAASDPPPVLVSVGYHFGL
ncbi:MAG TPA: hypothetical protein VGE21_07895 [Flavobacteriales bacterium]